ncbi:MAG: tetratricopeptide repeat protein, partial [Deltaproteobacteria bacterium]|nr:tetratricopeptide repeat protein [Deltaproteobacteria bacterium]
MNTFHKLVGALLLGTLAALTNQTTALCDENSGVGRHGGDTVTFQENALPQEIKTLDMKLATALKLYYDGKYAEALPIFSSISQKLQTTELAVLEGKCAARAGEFDKSIETFQQLLSRNPNLHRVRMELADALYMSKQYAAARKELEKIETAALSKSMISKTNSRLERIERQRQV